MKNFITGNRFKFSFISLNIILFSILSLTEAALASKVEIKNEDTAKVDITIEPGEGNIAFADKNSIKISLQKNETKTIEVNKQQMEKETFSITGTVKMPSLYNKCGPLHIDKDYKIIFTGAKSGGTICITKPLKN
jgi:hypothetical protein